MRRTQEVAKRMLDYCVAHPGTRARIVPCYAGYKTEALESLVPAGTVHERYKFRFVFANGSVIDYAPITKKEPDGRGGDLIVETLTAMVDQDGLVR